MPRLLLKANLSGCALEPTPHYSIDWISTFLYFQILLFTVYFSSTFPPILGLQKKKKSVCVSGWGVGWDSSLLNPTALLLPLAAILCHLSWQCLLQCLFAFRSHSLFNLLQSGFYPQWNYSGSGHGNQVTKSKEQFFINLVDHW